MADWQTTWQTMRAQFLVRARERLAGTESLLSALASDRANRQLLLSVHRDLHWLSGVGGTYKLTALSEIGTPAEDVCQRLLESQSQPDDSALNTMRSCVLDARRWLAGLEDQAN